MPKLKSKEKKRLKKKKTPQNIQKLWDNYKSCNILVVGIPEGEENKEGTLNIFEAIMTENFPNLMSDIESEIQEFREQHQTG